MKKPRWETIIRVLRYLEHVAKKDGDMSIDSVAGIFLGLDDMNHNRLYRHNLKTGKSRKVPHYGDARYAKRGLR